MALLHNYVTKILIAVRSDVRMVSSSARVFKAAADQQIGVLLLRTSEGKSCL
jgi:hypothetical protein